MWGTIKGLCLCLLGVTALGACGGRPERWDAKTELPLTTQGLAESIAIVDGNLDRVLMLTASSDRSLRSTPLGVGKNVVKTETSKDRQSLFVLSSGVQPRRSPDDERPSLTVIDGRMDPGVTARYSLTDPLTGLAVDPEGEWVVVYDAGGVVVNPNELIFVKVGEPSFEPFSKTIRSFGGRPQRITFTRELAVPNGTPRRFVIVETTKTWRWSICPISAAKK